MGARFSSAAERRQNQPIQLARLKLTVATLREEASRLREEASLRGRVSADEAAPFEEQARHCERTIDLLVGDRVDLVAGEAEGPPPRRCEYPECNELATYGFGEPTEPQRWSCAAHRKPVSMLWQNERDQRLEVLTKPKTSMAGVGNRLI